MVIRSVNVWDFDTNEDGGIGKMFISKHYIVEKGADDKYHISTNIDPDENNDNL